MSWLRLDDGFADHPKIAALDDADYRRWTRTLLYCARQRSPVLTVAVLERVLGWDEDGAMMLLELGLLDDVDERGYLVHDWPDYNGAKTDAERKRAERARKYGADYRGKPVGQHGGARGEYRTVTSSHGQVTDTERDGSVSIVRAGIPIPKEKEVNTPTSDERLARERIDPSRELLTARLLARLPNLEPGKADYIRGACARLPDSVPAGILELLDAGGHVRDPVAYVIGALTRELRDREAGVASNRASSPGDS